jgi:TetR/AcrR family transcriptional repressor of mexJK operon
MASNTVKAEDPRIGRSRTLILDAAMETFVERGFDRASVDDIAARAGVAKRTVYNIYGDKEALFRATIQRAIDVAESFTAALAEAAGSIDDPATELPELAERLAGAVLVGPVLGLRRLLTSESRTFPEFALEYRRRAPDAVMQELARTLADADHRGLLRVPDAEVAAEHFAFLVMGADLDRGMFDPTLQRPADEVAARARGGADVFLRAYRA